MSKQARQKRYYQAHREKILSKTRAHVRRLREQRIHRGLCGRCGKEPLTTKTLGERCGFYHKLYECGIQP
jgi:hypothetical protein